jgi:hypothetical protein
MRQLECCSEEKRQHDNHILPHLHDTPRFLLHIPEPGMCGLATTAAGAVSTDASVAADGGSVVGVIVVDCGSLSGPTASAAVTITATAAAAAAAAAYILLSLLLVLC